MTAFVLDASAGVELLLDTTVGLSIQDQIPANAEWWTPEHYFVEVSGALRRALIRGVAAEALVHEAFQRLATVPIHRAQIRPLLTDAWSKRDNLTIADALYVTLAEHVHATLVTADMRIVRAPGLSVATIHP